MKSDREHDLHVMNDMYSKFPRLSNQGCLSEVWFASYKQLILKNYVQHLKETLNKNVRTKQEQKYGTHLKESISRTQHFDGNHKTKI